MSITVSRMHRPDSHFTLVSNDYICADISPAAKVVGLHALKQPPGFVLTQERLAEMAGMSRNTVSKALRELQDAGYLISRETRDRRGHKIGSHLYVSDTGFTPEERESLCTKTAHRADAPSDSEQPVLKNCAEPCSKIEQHNKTVTKTKTKRGAREGATAPPAPDRLPLPEIFSDTAIKSYAARTGLPEAVVRNELDLLRVKRKTANLVEADALAWLLKKKGWLLDAADKAPNVSSLYGQGTLFEPGSGDRRRAWLTERVAEREAQEAAAPSVPSCEESPEAIRRRILRSLETA